MSTSTATSPPGALQYRWLSAPAPPALPGGYVTREVVRPDGARIVYLEWNAGSRGARAPAVTTAAGKHGKDDDVAADRDDLGPIVFLHGGLASSECWAHQIAHVLQAHRAPDGQPPWVISIDSRGQGRSTFGDLNFPRGRGRGQAAREGAEGTSVDVTPELTYTQMGDDTVAVLDALRVQRARLVGWSDGAILCLDLLLRYAGRVGAAYAFAANYAAAGGLYTGPASPATAQADAWARAAHMRVSPRPDDYPALRAAVLRMWATWPQWTLDTFAAAARVNNDDSQDSPGGPPITTTTPGVPNDTSRLWIVDGDHEEAVAIEQSYALAKTMPQATLLILPATSHFAMVQDPVTFNQTLDAFLAYTPPLVSASVSS